MQDLTKLLATNKFLRFSVIDKITKRDKKFIKPSDILLHLSLEPQLQQVKVLLNKFFQDIFSLHTEQINFLTLSISNFMCLISIH
jgi:hypothetical protein